MSTKPIKTAIKDRFVELLVTAGTGAGTRVYKDSFYSSNTHPFVNVTTPSMKTNLEGSEGESSSYSLSSIDSHNVLVCVDVVNKSNTIAVETSELIEAQIIETIAADEKLNGIVFGLDYIGSEQVEDIDTEELLVLIKMKYNVIIVCDRGNFYANV